MSIEEKMALIADILELEEGDFTEETLLEEIETWDSVAVLSVIALMNEKFDKYPHARDIVAYKTVGDLLNAMC